MFRCQRKECNKVCEPRQPQHTIVIQTREKVYTREIHRPHQPVRVDEVIGWEIVKEIKVCPECYQELTGKEPMKVQEVTNVRKLSEELRNEPKPWHRKNYRPNPHHKQKKQPQVQRINEKHDSAKSNH